jgi:fumarate reductase subunit C
MKQEVNLIRARLKRRAAAVAGILFSLLLTTGLSLLRLSVRADPLEAGAWPKTNSNTVALTLNLVPFAGIAFFMVHRRAARPPRRAASSFAPH